MTMFSMKSVRGVALVLGLAASLPTAAAAGVCKDDRVDLRGDWGKAAFTVAVADTAAERSQGLMNVPEMAAGAGMLFVYPSSRRATFWMRNTLIPLDMIFADEAGRVTRVHSNAVPLDETTIDGGPGVQYVLEINGGLAERLGIAPGTQLRHSAIPATRAAWPCE